MLDARLMSRVSPEPNTGCWLWTGATTPKGYGWVKFAGRPHHAHRVFFLLSGRSIPEGYEIDHLCRVKNCVNPDHLEAVDPTENTRRMLLARGKRLGFCKCGRPFDRVVGVKRRRGTCSSCQRKIRVARHRKERGRPDAFLASGDLR